MNLYWKFALMMLVLVCVSESFRHPTRLNCCKEVSKGRIPPEYKVTGYKHQNALGECVKAIILYTDKGTFCADPEADWIQELVPALERDNIDIAGICSSLQKKKQIHSASPSQDPATVIPNVTESKDVNKGTFIKQDTMDVENIKISNFCYGTETSDHRPTRVDVSCCKKVSKGKIPAQYKVTAFKHQNALSPCVEAIIFYTEKDMFCYDPKAPWIQNRLKDLKEIKD